MVGTWEGELRKTNISWKGVRGKSSCVAVEEGEGSHNQATNFWLSESFSILGKLSHLSESNKVNTVNDTRIINTPTEPVTKIHRVHCLLIQNLKNS